MSSSQAPPEDRQQPARRAVSDVAELSALVADGPGPLVFTAGGSKSVGVPAGAVEVDVSALRGVVEYEPSEFTVTAGAATPVAEVARMLGEHRQWMPFDPLLAERGATLGGTVAANSAGPGRFRHGGIRDFVLGVRFVDGSGREIRSGGRVVKNAAGLDLSKLMVGSLGSLGCLTEVTFKVFPAPPSRATLFVHQLDLAAAAGLLESLSGQPLQPDAVDLHSAPVGRGVERWTLAVRVAGPEESLDRRLEGLVRWARVRAVSEHDVEVTRGRVEETFWGRTRELGFVAPGLAAVKLPVHRGRFLDLEEAGVTVGLERVFCADQQLLLSVPPDRLAALASELDRLRLTGALLGGGGTGDPPLLGHRRDSPLLDRVRRALDPRDVFRPLWPGGFGEG